MKTMSAKTKNPKKKVQLPIARDLANSLLWDVYMTWDRIRDTTDMPEEVKSLVDSMWQLSFYVFEESVTEKFSSVVARDAVYQDVAKAIFAITKISGAVQLPENGLPVRVENLLTKMQAEDKIKHQKASDPNKAFTQKLIKLIAQYPEIESEIVSSYLHPQASTVSFNQPIVLMGKLESVETK
jgi:hypothetical protein